MIETVAVLGILVIAAALVAIAVRGRRRQVARERVLRRDGIDADFEPLAGPSRRVSIRRYLWVAALVAVAVGLLLRFVLDWPIGLALAAAVVVALLGWQVDSMWYNRRVFRLETQLADTIDMMVAAVKAGSSLQSSLESAAVSTRKPLKPELEEVIGRIRYGDDPSEVLVELEERLPLETVRLFSNTLAVNWQVGGRLAQTLANVGRTIRDRIELTRRMHTMSAQARFSVMSILAVTYFLAALVWRNDPSRMRGFLLTTVGQGAVIAAVILQGLGIVWIASLSRIKF
ncbi:MAG: type II secretion system F family protein [Planctomycetota bacterium]